MDIQTQKAFIFSNRWPEQKLSTTQQSQDVKTYKEKKQDLKFSRGNFNSPTKAEISEHHQLSLSSAILKAKKHGIMF